MELAPALKALKMNEVHPVYKLQYLLYRRVSVEEPHQLNGPVQCTNCQEFGHILLYASSRMWSLWRVPWLCWIQIKENGTPATKRVKTVEVATRQTIELVRFTRSWKAGFNTKLQTVPLIPLKPTLTSSF